MTYPIVIAGGGPVGLMLACELGLAGVETLVLERQPEPNEQSRGGAINAAVVELLTQRGLMEALRGDGFEFTQAHFAHLPLDAPRVPERHAFSFAVPHARLEQRLAERAVKLGVDIRRDAEVVGLAQDPDGVVLTVRTGGTDVTVRGSHLVGCDGAQSTVRGLAGIGFPGTTPRFYGMLGDLVVEPGNPLLARIGKNQYETGLCTVVPTSPTTLRVMTGEFGIEPEDRTAPVTFEELSAAYTRLTGAELQGVPQWLSRWDATSRQAERYRVGRVFLAGDAAHVHFPLGGQALSTGIEDAVNLGWKLAAEVAGWAAPDLLDTYESERYPVGARACLTTRAQTALMHGLTEIAPLREVLGDLLALDEVNTYLVKMVGGIDIHYPMGEKSSESHAVAQGLKGSRLADIPLIASGGSTSVAQLLASGRGLLLDLSGQGQASDLAGWTDRVDHVRAEPTAEIDAAAVLLRPDGRVAWATDVMSGERDETLSAALRKWFGAADTARSAN
ncbi:FAD-dependent monooxygenase [Streptomyces sp. NPDC048516]|uniref:FAD-dependent monooxygenase n=1 Tax=Streptomyces sp. NPDC048516 TaxID=3365565 RepID=UPI00371F718C